jgi:hypothetical protein
MIMIIPYLVSAILISAVLCLLVGVYNFFNRESLIIVIEEVKLLLILIVFPLFPQDKAIKSALWNFLIFFLIFLPLTLISAIIGGVNIIPLIICHLLFLFIWMLAFVAMKYNLLNWYYLFSFTISAVLPLLYYLILELYGKSAFILLYFNPFWIVFKILAQ